MKLSSIASFVLLVLLACFVSGVAAEESNNTSDSFEIGNLAIQQEKWDQAISFFSNVVENDPGNEVAWFKLGGSYLQNGEVEKSYNAYQKAIEANPEYADAWAMTGYVYLYGMVPPDAAGALAAYEKAATSLSDDSGVQINYGIANLLTGNYEKAESILSSLTEADPVNERAWYWLGITRSDNGDLEGGLEAYTKAVEINPAYKDAWFAKGDVEGFLGKQDESEQTFKKLLALTGDYAEPFKTSEANDAEVYYRLGVIEYNNENDAGALQNFEKALELNPANHNAWYYKGLIEFTQEDYVKSRESFNKATELKDQFANAWYWKGRLDLREQQFDTGIADLQKATEIDSNLTDAWYYLGGVLGDQGRNEEAVSAFEKVTELQPEFADGWYFKGLNQYQLALLPETADSYEQALALTSETFTPDLQANAWFTLGMIRTNDGDTESAAEAFNESLALNATNSGTWNAYGIALNDISNFEEALKAFEKAISIDEKTSEYWFNKGNVLRNMNQTEDALKSYDEAIEIDPQPRVLNSKGIALMQIGQDEKAVEAFDAGLKLDENLAVLWFNKAGALLNLGKLDEALESVNKALELDSAYEAAITLKDQITQKMSGEGNTTSSPSQESGTSTVSSIVPEELPSGTPTVAPSDFEISPVNSSEESQS